MNRIIYQRQLVQVHLSTLFQGVTYYYRHDEDDDITIYHIADKWPKDTYAVYIPFKLNDVRIVLDLKNRVKQQIEAEELVLRFFK